MKIQPIVEGHGDVKAVPILLRRLTQEAGVFTFDISRPIRRKSSDLRTQLGIEKAVRLARNYSDCGAILFLFDADDSCPKELAPTLLKWARPVAGPIPCSVVLAYREYETWLLSAIESLRGKCSIRQDASFQQAFEHRRGAKEILEGYMPRGTSYHESVDQATLTAALDLSMAYRRSRSFRKVVKSMGDILSGLGNPLSSWPPPSWTEG
jgi:hypothetical protein